MTAYNVSFRIVKANAPDGAERARHMAGVLREALGLPADASTGEWVALVEPRLLAGEQVRVRVSADQLCRFFIGRRAAGVDTVKRLKWFDAVEDVVAAPRKLMSCEQQVACPRCGARAETPCVDDDARAVDRPHGERWRHADAWRQYEQHREQEIDNA